MCYYVYMSLQYMYVCVVYACVHIYMRMVLVCMYCACAVYIAVCCKLLIEIDTLALHN